MQSSEEYIQTLHMLGLTPLQAKIYLILLRAGKQKVQTIANIASIDRANTYQAVAQLQKMGLVDKILGTACFCQAIPLEDGVSTLLAAKEKQYREIRKQAAKIMQPHDANYYETKEGPFEIKVVNRDRARRLEGIRNLIKNSQESWDLLFSKKRFRTTVIGLAEEQLGCIKRGVEYRVITERTDFNAEDRKILEKFSAEPNFQIRFIPRTPSSDIVILDKKIVFLTLTPSSPAEGPGLVSDNKGFLEVIQSYFDMLWNQYSNQENAA